MIVRMLSNARKTAPAALNLGIAAARGEVIVRMDAHVEYPADYLSSLVKLLEQSGADNVGGVCRTLPASDAATARAVAFGMSHPLGVGNSHFRIGAAEDRWVDTVPFGCYRREVFDRIGPFDEELVRNQDDELNLRLIRRGGRILLSPRIECKYYARDSLAKLCANVLSIRLLQAAGRAEGGRRDDLAATVAAAVCAGFARGGPGGAVDRLGLVALAVIAGSYLLAIAAVAVRAIRRLGLAAAAALFGVFPAMHFSYGWGYLRGIVQFLILRRKRATDAGAVPISR